MQLEDLQGYPFCWTGCLVDEGVLEKFCIYS